jgi:hypothetical protein
MRVGLQISSIGLMANIQVNSNKKRKKRAMKVWTIMVTKKKSKRNKIPDGALARAVKRISSQGINHQARKRMTFRCLLVKNLEGVFQRIDRSLSLKWMNLIFQMISKSTKKKKTIMKRRIERFKSSYRNRLRNSPVTRSNISSSRCNSNNNRCNSNNKCKMTTVTKKKKKWMMKTSKCMSSSSPTTNNKNNNLLCPKADPLACSKCKMTCKTKAKRRRKMTLIMIT